MTRSTALWKVSAAAVPVLLLGSMSLATLSANATLESAFGADGVFAITVDGAAETTSSFDLDTLKPGETATKVVTLKNIGDIDAYTYLDKATITGDPAFGAVLTGTVEGNAVTSTSPLSKLTSLTEGAWVLSPGEELPVTLTVSAPVGATAVIEGAVGVSFDFEASSSVPATQRSVTYSKSAGALADLGADYVARYSFAGIRDSSNERIVNLLDIAGPGMLVSGLDSFNGSLASSTALTSSLSTVPGLSTYVGSSYMLSSAVVGTYTLSFDVNTLDGIGGAVVSTKPYVLTINIVA